MTNFGRGKCMWHALWLPTSVFSTVFKAETANPLAALNNVKREVENCGTNLQFSLYFYCAFQSSTVIKAETSIFPKQLRKLRAFHVE